MTIFGFSLFFKLLFPFHFVTVSFGHLTFLFIHFNSAYNQTLASHHVWYLRQTVRVNKSTFFFNFYIVLSILKTQTQEDSNKSTLFLYSLWVSCIIKKKESVLQCFAIFSYYRNNISFSYLGFTRWLFCTNIQHIMISCFVKASLVLCPTKEAFFCGISSCKELSR